MKETTSTGQKRIWLGEEDIPGCLSPTKGAESGMMWVIQVSFLAVIMPQLVMAQNLVFSWHLEHPVRATLFKVMWGGGCLVQVTSRTKCKMDLLLVTLVRVTVSVAGCQYQGYEITPQERDQGVPPVRRIGKQGQRFVTTGA
eukprot:jgi/Mesvir1/26978/Mv20691-RA.1